MRRTFTVWLLIAFIALPASAIAQQQFDASSVLSTDQRDPLSISGLVLSPNVAQQALRVCFAFKNLTSENVTSAKFHFAILDQFGSERLTGDFIRNARSSWPPGRTVDPPSITGSGYSDTNDGSQSCWLIPNAGAALQSMQGVNNGKMSVTVLGLTFADGSTWARGQAFPRAFNHDGSAYSFKPEAFHTTWSTQADTAPVAVLDASINSYATMDNKARMEQCVTFRNLTNKVATGVTVGYAFSDASGTPLPASQDWHNTFTGKFTPPILIEDKCWNAALPAVDVVRRMRHEDVIVRTVAFADGSQWTRGTQWVKAYGSDGNAYSGPQPLVTADAPAGAATPAMPAAAGIGGVVGGATSQLFGEIAWVAGSTTAFGSAVDKSTLFDAQYEAMSGCKSRAGAAEAGNCKLLLNGQGLNSAATRCAVLLFDGRVYAVGRGATQDDADLDAINGLRARGGSIDGAHTLVKACNAR